VTIGGRSFAMSGSAAAALRFHAGSRLRAVRKYAPGATRPASGRENRADCFASSVSRVGLLAIRRNRYLSLTTLAGRDLASAMHSLITLSNATGVNGLRRHRDAPSSRAILRKSGAGESRFAKA